MWRASSAHHAAASSSGGAVAPGAFRTIRSIVPQTALR